jgi:hypothetical protein
MKKRLIIAISAIAILVILAAVAYLAQPLPAHKPAVASNETQTSHATQTSLPVHVTGKLNLSIEK